jgi:hypothetical protein
MKKTPSGLKKTLIPQYSRGKVKVYYVDGDYVRNNIYPDYTEGGHGYVYNFIPKTEVWLDKENITETKPILVHELHERHWMAKGLDYENAHDKANVVEQYVRHNPRQMKRILKAELTTNGVKVKKSQNLYPKRFGALKHFPGFKILKRHDDGDLTIKSVVGNKYLITTQGEIFEQLLGGRPTAYQGFNPFMPGGGPPPVPPQVTVPGAIIPKPPTVPGIPRPVTAPDFTKRAPTPEELNIAGAKQQPPPAPAVQAAQSAQEIKTQQGLAQQGVNPPLYTPETPAPSSAKPFDISTPSGIKAYVDYINGKSNATDAEKAFADSAKEANYNPRAMQITAEDFTTVTGYKADGTLLKVRVNSSDYDKAMALSDPYKKADALNKLGILPKGTTVITDVKDYNARFGTDHTKDFPFALPNEEKAVNKAVRDESVSQRDESVSQLNAAKWKFQEEARARADFEKRVNLNAAKWDFQNEAAFKRDLKSQPQELQDAYNKGGLDAYNEAVKDYNQKIAGYNRALNYESDITAQYDSQQKAALNAAKPYMTFDVARGGNDQSLSTDQMTAGKMPGAILTGTQSLDLIRYIKDGKDPDILKPLGITQAQIQQTQDYVSAEKGHDGFIVDYFKAKGWDTSLPGTKNLGVEPKQSEIATYQAHLDEADKKYYDIVGQGKRPGNIIKEFAINMIPIYGTIHYAQQAAKQPGGIKGGEVAWIVGSSILDLLTIVPIVGQVSAAARGTYLGEESGKFLTAGVRAGEVAKATGRFAVSQFTAPFVMLAHPLETLKAGISPIETIVRGKKIPLSAIESKWNTMRVPISAVGDEKTTMQLRDAVTDALINGRDAEVEMNGVRVKIPPTAVNRLGEPTAISSTPDIRPFMDGAVIGKGSEVELTTGKSIIMGEGRDMYVSPIFHSRFAEATSTGMQIKDAVPGGLIIRDPAVLSQIDKSGQIYAETAEIEAKLKAAKNIELGKPSQVLMTRTPYGKKLTLLVFGKPYTAAEIAEMKMIGSADTIKQIFTAPISVSKVFSGYNELTGMVARREELIQEAENLRRAGRTAELARANADLGRLGVSIDRTYANLQAEYRKVGLPMRTVMVRTTQPARDISFKDMDRLLKSYRPATKAEVRTMPEPERRALDETRRQLGSIPVRPTRSDGELDREIGSSKRMITKQAPRVATKTATRAATREAIRQPVKAVTRTAIKPPIRPPVGTTTPRPPVKTPPPRPPVKTPPLRPPISLQKLVAPTKAPGPLRLPKGDKTNWTPEEIHSAVAFEMGKLMVGAKSQRFNKKTGEYESYGGKLEPMIIAHKAPYGIGDKKFFIGEIPEGMKMAPNEASAYATIQQLKGKSPSEFKDQQGFASYTVSNPSAKPGKSGAISFGIAKRIPDPTKRVAKELSSPMRNISQLSGGQFKTKVRGGTLLSDKVVRGR